MTSPHQILNPENLPRPRGYSHVVLPAPGRLIFLSGQTAQLPDGRLGGENIATQFDVSAGNVIEALTAAGAGPGDVVSLQIFVTDVEAYQASLRPIGESYRRHFGTHLPAITLVEVKRLFERGAMVELTATAVVPDNSG